MRDRKDFSLLDDNGMLNTDNSTIISDKFNPASGYVESPKKMLVGQFSAEIGLNQTGNVLYRVLGQMQHVITKVKLIEYLPAILRSLFPVCVCRRFLVKLSLVHRKRFLVIFPSSNLGESGFHNFTLSPSF